MAKKAFNLTDLLSTRSVSKEAQNQATESHDGMELLWVDIDDLVPTEENFYSMDGIEGLKWSIRLLGILQPLLVRPTGDKYEIHAGHRRTLACQELVSEGDDRFRLMPCVVKPEDEVLEDDGQVQDILERLYVIGANSFRDKTDWERMTEALQQEELVRQLKKAAKLPGRVREILKSFSGGAISEAQMGRYAAIQRKLYPELMEEFKAGNINVSVAYEAQKLSTKYQEAAYEAFKEHGILSLADVRGLQERESDETAAAQREPAADAETQAEPIPETTDRPEFAGMNPPEEPEPAEEFYPQPEQITSICYSCLNWSECGIKSDRATACNSYINKAEAEKTEEQRYSEQQDAIDRETAKSLKAQQQDELMENRPKGPIHKEHDVKLAAEFWDDVVSGRKCFELRKNDRGYKVGDMLNMSEFKAGEKTGRRLRAEIIYMLEDYTGLTEGYCILGIKILEVK